MNDVKYFIQSLKGVLSALDAGRTARYRNAARRPLREQYHEDVGRRLRRAATAKITEPDTDVLGDLMKMIKKLGKDSIDSTDDLDRRFKMTLNLLEHAVSKKTPTAPDHIMYLFNKFYSGLGYLFPSPTTQPTT